MAIETTGLGVSIDTTPIERTIRLLDQLNTAGIRTQQTLGNLGGGGGGSSPLSPLLTVLNALNAGVTTLSGNITNVTTKITNLNTTISQLANQSKQLQKNPFSEWKMPNFGAILTGGIAGFSAASLGKEYIEAADTMQLLDARLKNATKSTGDFEQAQKNVVDIADKAHQPIDAVGTSYARLSRSLGDLGANQNQVSKVTLAVADSLRISGATTQEAAASTIQLSQAFNSGKLAGDEFRSVAENNPRLLRALADALDVPTGALRQMSKEGKLTADVIANALVKEAANLREESEAMGVTVSQAWVDIKNAATEAVGENNKASGSTKDLVSNMKDFATYLKSDDFKSALSGAVSLVALLAKGLGDAFSGWDKFIKDQGFNQSGYVDGDADQKTRQNQFNDLVSQRQDLLDKQSTLNGVGGLRSALGLGYKDGERQQLQNDIDDITNRIAIAQDQEKQRQLKDRQQSLFGGVTGGLVTTAGDGDPELKSNYTGPDKKKRTRTPSDRTGQLADKAETDQYDSSNTALNKYRDTLLKITEAREADIKSGRNQAEVQDNVDRAVASALVIYQKATKDGLQKYNDETRKLTAEADGPAVIALQKFADGIEAADKALSDGVINQDAYTKRVAALGQVYDKTLTDVDQKNNKVSTAVKSAIRNVQSAWADTIQGVLDGTTTKASDIAKVWSNMIAKMIAEAEAAKLTEALIGKDGSSGLVGVATKYIGTLFGGSSGSSAIGNYDIGKGTGDLGGYSAGNTDYLNLTARGGIVKSSQLVPMANGGMNLRGEAGPEGVLPLAVGSDGDLGVKVAGGGGGVTNNINVHNYGDQQVQTKTTANSSGGADIDVLVGMVEGKMAKRMANGVGDMHDATAGRFGLDTARSL